MLESDVDKNRGNSTFGDDTVNNPGRSTVTKIETDTSCPQFDGLLILDTCIQMKVM